MHSEANLGDKIRTTTHLSTAPRSAAELCPFGDLAVPVSIPRVVSDLNA
jgi:hypothetical protein